MRGSPPPCDVKYGLDMITEAADTTSYIVKRSVRLYIALSKFKVTNKNEYDIKFETPESTRDTFKLLTGYELIALYNEITEAYPIIPIKDPFNKYN